MLRRSLATAFAFCLGALAACGGGGGGGGTVECSTPCFTPPPATCVDGQAVAFDSFGQCVDGQCQYPPRSPEDCAADGLVCEAGECVAGPNPCDDFVCPPAPEPSCESEDAVMTYPNPPTCSIVDGEPSCDYEAVSDACRRSQWCADGECVPRPCYGVDCLTPPARECVGDVITTYEEVGACNMETEECEYPVATTVDCAETGQYCNRGRCQTPNPCDGVTCTEIPDAFCAGSVLHTFSAGTCAAGECNYPETTRNCVAEGKLCRDATCRERAPCEDVVCGPAPETYCDGDELVTFGAEGTCVEDDCEYPITRTNCAATDQICLSGACVDPDPCDGILCWDRPAPFCDGTVAIRYSVPGTCVDGVCRWTETEQDCAATDEVCFAGDCESDDPCDGIVCSELPARHCDGNVAVSYGFPGECSDGTCFFVEYEESCDGIGSSCDSGACVSSDPCAGVTCTTLPTNRCVGDLLYKWAGTGRCVDGDCNHDSLLTITDCAETGKRCRSAACVLPGASLGAGDLLITEIAPSMPGGDQTLQWFEIAVPGEGTVDLSGLVIRNAAGVSFTLPAGSVAHRRFVLGASAAAVPGGPNYVWPASFHLSVSNESLRLVGATTVDTLAWSAADGWAFIAGRAFALSIFGETVGRNDDRAEWCSSSYLYGAGLYGTPGGANGACGGPVRAGNLQVTEVMVLGEPRPGGVEQWVEVKNTTAGSLDVSGTRISTGEGAYVIPWGTILPAGGFFVIGVDDSVAGGPDDTYGLDMPIDPDGDVITIRLGATLVETADFSAGAGGGFPYSAGRSMQRNAGSNPALPASWCPGSTPYDGYGENFGTPGAAAVCP